MVKIIKVEPIYGNGWCDKASSIDVPEVFEIEVCSLSNEEIVGVVSTLSHLLTGYEIKASNTFEANKLYYSCLFTLMENTIFGYCIIRSF